MVMDLQRFTFRRTLTLIHGLVHQSRDLNLTSKNGVVILSPFFPSGVVTQGEDVTRGFMGDSNEPHSQRGSRTSKLLRKWSK